MDLEFSDENNPFEKVAMRGELKSKMKKDRDLSPNVIKTTQDYFKKAPRIRDIGKFMLNKVLTDLQPMFTKQKEGNSFIELGNKALLNYLRSMNEEIESAQSLDII